MTILKCHTIRTRIMHVSFSKQYNKNGRKNSKAGLEPRASPLVMVVVVVVVVVNDAGGMYIRRQQW